MKIKMIQLHTKVSCCNRLQQKAVAEKTSDAEPKAASTEETS